MKDKLNQQVSTKSIVNFFVGLFKVGVAFILSQILTIVVSVPLLFLGDDPNSNVSGDALFAIGIIIWLIIFVGLLFLFFRKRKGWK